MNLIRFSLSFLFCVSTIVVKAQQPNDSVPVKSGNEWQMPKLALQQSRKFADSVKEKCSLDDISTKKVFNAYLSNTKSVDEIRLGQGSEKDKQKLLALNRDQLDNTLKGILTPAQYEMYHRGRAGR